MTVLFLILGFVLLVAGGEWLVRGAATLASAAKVSPLVIGLTVVAFGTSAPELGVSLQAAASGNAGVAVGNVVGSNIMNILLVLGVSAIITPLVVAPELVRRDVPWMVGATLAVWGMSIGGVSRWEGAILFAALVVYLTLCIRSGRGNLDDLPESVDDIAQTAHGKRFVLINLAYFFAGLAMLGLGSRWLVGSAVQIAESWGVSELVIGLTVVAIGTSLPEAVTSVVAAIRGQRDIAVGNVVGSNLFNLLCVLGLTATVSSGGVPVEWSAIRFDMPVMVAVALVAVPMMVTRGGIGRWEGGLLVMYLVAYLSVMVSYAVEFPWAGWIAALAMAAVAASLLPIGLDIRSAWRRSGGSTAA